MNDTTTEQEMILPAAPVSERRAAYAGEMDRVRAELAAAREQIARHEQTIHALRYEQITDGTDPRLAAFWEKAGEVADEENFCDEYDRLAEQMGGPRRTRDWDVEVDVTVTVRVLVTVSATDEDDAAEIAAEEVDLERVIDAARDNGYEQWETDVYSTHRA